MIVDDDGWLVAQVGSRGIVTLVEKGKEQFWHWENRERETFRFEKRKKKESIFFVSSSSPPPLALSFLILELFHFLSFLSSARRNEQKRKKNERKKDKIWQKNRFPTNTFFEKEIERRRAARSAKSRPSKKTQAILHGKAKQCVNKTMVLNKSNYSTVLQFCVLFSAVF